MATTRKATPKATPTDPRAETLASVMSAPNAAAIARILGRDGKQVRNFARGTLGCYPNDGVDGGKHAGSHVTLTDDDKRALFDKFYRAPVAPTPKPSKRTTTMADALIGFDDVAAARVAAGGKVDG